MNRRSMAAIAGIVLATAGAARAQDGQPVPVPVVTVSASATASVPNDRLHAWLRAEGGPCERVGRRRRRQRAGHARAREAQGAAGRAGLDVGLHVAADRREGQAHRWRVVQTIKVEGGDFAAIGDAIGAPAGRGRRRAVGHRRSASSDELRRRTQDAITQQAIAAWRTRAQNAAQGFGAAGWRARPSDRPDRRRRAVPTR